LPERDAKKLRRRRTVEPGFRQRIENRFALQPVEVVGQRFPELLSARSSAAPAAA